jgi:hypothetical protein
VQNNLKVDVKMLVSYKLFAWYWARVLVNMVSSVVCVGLVLRSIANG